MSGSTSIPKLPSEPAAKAPRLSPVIYRGQRVSGVYRDTRSKGGKTLVLKFRLPNAGGLYQEWLDGPDRGDVRYAIQRRDEVKGEAARGRKRRDTRETFAQYAQRWVRSYRGRTARGVSPRTIAGYARDLERHVLPVLGPMRLSAIDPSDVRELVRRLEMKGLRRNTVRGVIASVRALLATAHGDGLIATNPASGLRLPMEDTAKRKHLEDDELRALYEATDPQWQLAIRLLAFSGCRISEFIALRWSDLDFDLRTLRIDCQWDASSKSRIPPKSRHGVRTIRLTADLIADLRRWRLASKFSTDDHPLFPSRNGSPLNQSNFDNRVFRPAAKAAGLEWATPHSLRHTCGTRLARQGYRAEEIAAWLGHHSASFSLDTYIGRPTEPPEVEGRGLDLLARDKTEALSRERSL